MLLYHDAAIILKARKKRALPRHDIAKRTDACFESRLTAHESSRRERQAASTRQQGLEGAGPVFFLILSLPRYNWNFGPDVKFGTSPSRRFFIQKEGNLYKATTQSINTNSNVNP
jgi:hypothetical protein